MIYKEMQNCLNEGKIIKSEQCLYMQIDGFVYWKWIGEMTWTKGDGTLNDCVNESEKSENWEVVFDSCLSNY